MYINTLAEGYTCSASYLRLPPKLKDDPSMSADVPDTSLTFILQRRNNLKSSGTFRICNFYEQEKFHFWVPFLAHFCWTPSPHLCLLAYLQSLFCLTANTTRTDIFSPILVMKCAWMRSSVWEMHCQMDSRISGRSGLTPPLFEQT